MKYIDTHAHYNDEAFSEDRESVLEEIREAGCEAVVNCAEDYPSSLECVKLAEEHPFVFAAAGIHPHKAFTYSPEIMEKIEALAKHPKVVAIGEAGLDYHYDFSPRDVQKVCFAENIRLAKRTGKPVVVHDREAHEDTLEIMKNERIPEGGAVLHCFSGSAEMAKIVAKHGWYFSIGGAVTFKNARRVIEALAVIPDELLMLETDCPYMTPVPFRGTRNNSALIPYTAAAIAEVKGVSAEEICELTTANAKRFFGINV